MTPSAPTSRRTASLDPRPPARPPEGEVGRLTPISWAPARKLDFAEWETHGRRLGTAGRGASWWIGDWLNYGDAEYGEYYARASQITGYEVQSLMNMAYVASHVDFSRRREKLSWSHHAELASLPASDQDAWLDRVAAEELSVRALRQELRLVRGLPPPDADEEEGRSEQVVCPACGHEFSPASAATTRA